MDLSSFALYIAKAAAMAANQTEEIVKCNHVSKRFRATRQIQNEH
jgi:hypothetical protein